MKTLRSFVIAIVAIVLLAHNGLAQTHREFFMATVRVDINGDGTYINGRGFIPLNTPDNGGGFFGTAIEYPPPHGDKENCVGEKYLYMVVDIGDEWAGWLYVEVEGEEGVYQLYRDPDTDETFAVFPADCQRYWDWVYEGYHRETELDFSTNCHGLAFGVGDWPASAEPLLGPQIVQNGDPAPPPGCYTSTTNKKEATIAVNTTLDHSIEVEGAECEDPDPDPEIVLPPGQVHTVQVIVKTREQWRESGIYKQTAECPDSVDLKKGRLHSELELILYKKNNSD